MLVYKVVKLTSLLQLGRFISTHASHAGRDPMLKPPESSFVLFQSTRPMRDATSDIHKFKSLFKTFLMLSQQNFALLVTKSDFTTNKTMFILCKLGVIIKTASSSH